MSKRVKHRIFALFLAGCMTILLAGCTPTGNERFKVVAKLKSQSLCVAFRSGDKVGEAVSAAMQVVQADGKVASLSRKWFNEDLSKLKGDDYALDELALEPEARTLLVGYDKGHLPFSGQDSNGEPIGFDIEFAAAVCEELGWKVRFLPVDVGKAEIELKSGNVDCIWGGFAMEDNPNIAYSPVYMENTVIVASLTNSGISREASLSGKTLAVSETGQFNAVLNTKPELVEKLQYLVVLPGSADDCFTELLEGSCDAIVTDLAAINYHR